MTSFQFAVGLPFLFLIYHDPLTNPSGNAGPVGFGDGLLGEPPMGGGDMFSDQLANQSQLNQLMMAQQLLQQQVGERDFCH